MTYEQSIAYIVKSYTKGSKRGLEEVRRLLHAVGDPQEGLQVIHVAGTNGKGSVCAMLARILEENGFRVGLFTSPHLLRFNERISINREEISDVDFARQVTDVKIALGQLTGSPDETMSFFEILTVVAFRYFYEKNVDYVVLETGLGGLFDTTNVITKPLLSVITSIGYDHMAMLGSTLTEIAVQKAGIVKESRPVVLHLTSEEVYHTISEISAKKSAKLYDLGRMSDIRIEKSDLSGTVFSFTSKSQNNRLYEHIKIALLGEHQVYNACTVLLCVVALAEEGLALDQSAVRRGLENTRWPGRMEVIDRQPTVVLDGAHNIDGAEAFDSSMERYFRDKSVIVVAGVLQNKEYDKMIRILTRHAAMVIATQPATGKALPAEVLAGCIEDRTKTIVVEPDCGRAMEEAFKAATDRHIIGVAGSLYLVGDVKRYLLLKEIQHDRF